MASNNMLSIIRVVSILLIFGSTSGTDLMEDYHRQHNQHQPHHGGVAASSSNNSVTEDILHQLPTTTLKELSDFVDGKITSTNFLKDVGGHVGVFVVKNLGDEFSSAMAAFRSAAPSCLANFDAHLPVSAMTDGSQRRTYATEDKVYPGCLARPMTILSKVYDQLESQISRVIVKMSGKKSLSYVDKNKSVVDISTAPIKDHLHVYSRVDDGKAEVVDETSKKKEEYLVPFHVDNGLFLLLTPFPAPSLQVRLSNGKVVSTAGLESSSVLVLMGRGLTDWLLQSSEASIFFPVPHAVPSLQTSTVIDRSVYARMKVVPMESLPADDPKATKKFSEIFFNSAASAADSKDHQQNEELCSGSVPEKMHLQQRQQQSPSSSAFFQANIKQCENNTAYCWMNCLPLPSSCSSHEYECYNKEHMACNTKDSGEPHDATCAWHCKSGGGDDDKFCDGGMDMLMGGFDVVGGGSGNGGNRTAKTCVILFFKSWKLNSAGKFAAACIGVFCLGFTIEGIIAVRRKIVNRKRLFLNAPILLRKLIVISLFAVNLVLGYLAMLVAMTYSVELFICVVAGLVVGHGLLNSHMPVGETVDPCCASQNAHDSSGERTPIAGAMRTQCDNVVYQEMAANGDASVSRLRGSDDEGDARSLCQCDATSNTNIKV